MELKHLLVLDFEATCCDDNSFPRNEMEIIEFPICVVDISTKQIIDEYHTYIKPIIHPILTNFCTNLTGIKQKTVNNGKLLITVLNEVSEFIKKYPDSIFVTHGDWDLKTILPTQIKKLKLNVNKRFSNWLNIKNEYELYYKRKGRGLQYILNELNLPLIGHHHSGIDDTRNIAQIAIKMINDGHKFEFDWKKLKNNFT
jgi:inhibitor of KinA sporulation pathway (predicted exonuclease)